MLLLRLYKSLVRPHLEYCYLCLGTPLCQGQSLVGVCATPVHAHGSRNEASAISHSSCTVGFMETQRNRHRADLLEVFRMYKGLSLTPFCRYFTLTPVNNTRGHSAKVLKNRCSLDLRRFFFSERVVDRWNSLPQHVIDLGSINAFKNGLNTMRRDSMGFFMD